MRADPVVSSTASQSGPDMRSRTEVYVRNCASAGGSRDRSSRRKYSDTNRSSPVKPARSPARRAGLHRQRREVQAGGPALRPFGQLGELARFELDSGRIQQQRGLLLVQPEVRHADLVHQPMRAPARERQRRLLPARDRDLRSGRNVLEQRREDVQTGRVGDGVHIVEHEHQRALECRERAPDARDALRPDRSARAGQRVEHLGRERLDAVERGRDVAQEHDGVVVPAVERDPRERTRIGLGPARKQRRLAVPGGRKHGRDRRGRRAQARDRVRLRHGARPRQRRGELDLDEVERSVRNGHRQRRSYERSFESDNSRRDEAGRFSCHRYEEAGSGPADTRAQATSTEGSTMAASTDETPVLDLLARMTADSVDVVGSRSAIADAGSHRGAGRGRCPVGLVSAEPRERRPTSGSTPSGPRRPRRDRPDRRHGARRVGDRPHRRRARDRARRARQLAEQGE